MKVHIENHDTKLYTAIYPNATKETVILLHGGPGVPNGLTFLTNYLSRNFQVVLFHQRGTQKSPNPSQSYSMDDYVSDINRVADYVKVEKFHLFGHSWGGLYAQIYAHQHPERLLSLFLCSPASGTGSQWKDTMLEIARYNKDKCSTLEWLSMNMHAGMGLLGSDSGYKSFFWQALENFSRDFKESHPEDFGVDCIRAEAINLTQKSILAYPPLQQFQQAQVKITIAYGAQDIIGDSKKYVLERYPNAKVHTIPKSGHIPWSHNQKEFVKVLKEHYGQ
ncbi:alpha/beta fold hydrolase [Rufibacter roseus]|uniref:Alpha/beta fold hydrolase n=1 Tax=Rufibacter roseus TaxID=1567108 RepID=A0ABW2DN68_9BACT|nr:alpha/beta hydrolase [Rufibacter roseus]